MRITVTLKIMLLITGLVTLISAGMPSQDKFKNLKVLPKNISQEALDKIMEGYAKSLGVKCNYCHIKQPGTDDLLDCASDNKPEKLMARKMMIMTNDINRKYFDFNKIQSSVEAVTCLTCHRGYPRPETDSIPLPGRN